MTTIRVNIANSDRRVGAMVKALAVEVAGFQAVKGTTKECLRNHGYYEFDFPHDYQAHRLQVYQERPRQGGGVIL